MVDGLTLQTTAPRCRQHEFHGINSVRGLSKLRNGSSSQTLKNTTHIYEKFGSPAPDYDSQMVRAVSTAKTRRNIIIGLMTMTLTN